MECWQCDIIYELLDFEMYHVVLFVVDLRCAPHAFDQDFVNNLNHGCHLLVDL